MFKLGELVSGTRHNSVGVIVETKVRLGSQYCKVLWAGDRTAHWVSSEYIRDRN